MSKQVEIDKASLRVVQFNLVAWSIICLTLGLSLRFGDAIPSVTIGEVILSTTHVTLIISAMIMIPIVSLANKFYKKHLMKFVKVKK